MPTTATGLEELLEKADWAAVDEAVRLGPAALPVVNRAAQHENYKTRQIAVTCAGRIGGDEAGKIVANALKDLNINVRIAAANQLAVNPPPVVTDAVLEVLKSSTEDLIRETLALAAGQLPGPKTIEVLRPLAESQGELASNARMALARLGDEEARKAIVQNLSAQSPVTRYRALEQLKYVGDPALAPKAKVLVTDQQRAVQLGTVRKPRFRRVCDQAVDTLVYLLKLKVAFEVGPEKIYSDAELAQIQDLIK